MGISGVESCDKVAACAARIDATVLKLQRIVALLKRMCVQTPHLGQERLWILELIEYMTKQSLIVARIQQSSRNPPQLHEVTRLSL